MIMASSTSHQQNGGTDNILRPRPTKTSNPAVLRAMADEVGQAEPQISAISRYVKTLYVRTECTDVVAVAAQLHFLKTLLHLHNRFPPLGSKYERSKSTECFRRWSTLLGYLTLIPGASTETSGAFSSSSGLDLLLW